MNIALSVLNAAALVALVAFHFQDAGQAPQAAVQPQPHYLHQTPQLAVMTDQTSRPQAATLTNDRGAPVATERLSNNDQRWVF